MTSIPGQMLHQLPLRAVSCNCTLQTLQMHDSLGESLLHLTIAGHEQGNEKPEEDQYIGTRSCRQERVQEIIRAGCCSHTHEER